MDNPLSTPVFAFTADYEQIVSAVFTTVGVFSAIDVTPAENQISNTKALWDTGATHSCISNRLARQLRLATVDYAHVATASGIEHVPTYLIHLHFPNGLQFLNWEVIQFQYTDDDCDLIIGMDIITQGDFSITNFGGRTLFSFRIPSQDSVDYETVLRQ